MTRRGRGRDKLAQTARVEILVRINFLTDDAAPMSSPYIGEICSLLVADSTNSLSVTGGEAIPANAGTLTSNPGFYDNNASLWVRKPGRCIRARIQRVSALGSSGTKLVSPLVGWSNSPLGGAGTNLQGITYFSAGYFGAVKMSSNVPASIDPDASDTYFTLSAVQRSVGALLIVNDNKLSFPILNGNFTPAYPQVSTLGTDRCPGREDFIYIGDLPYPWNDDWALATQRLAGARSANDTFTHEGACILEFVLTTVPSSGNIQVDFRKQDANNLWRLSVNNAGLLELIEVVAGTPTTRLSIPTNLAGDRLMVLADGGTLRLVRDRLGVETNSGVYLVGTNFQNNTSGIVTSLGTGGAISDLVAWPRNIPPYAMALLERVR